MSDSIMISVQAPVEIDWSKPVRELSQAIGIPEWKVRYLFRKHRHPIVPMPRVLRKKWTAQALGMKARVARFRAVDWSKTDQQIATEMGISRERVRQVRKAKGLPSSALLDHARFHFENVDWTKSIKEIAAQIGCAPDTVYRQRQKLGLAPLPNVRKHIYDFSDVDWKKETGTQVARRKGCSIVWACMVRRAAAWRPVVFASECDEDGNCPKCGIDYSDCPCPGPTQDGYEYEEREDGLYARPLK